MLKAPRHSHWLIIEDNCDNPRGISIKAEKDNNERVVCVNYPYAQCDLISMCRDIHKVLEKEGISNVVLEKTEFNLKIIKEITHAFPNSTITFCIVKGRTTIVDPNLKRVILNDYHHLPTGGHMGIARMIKNIQRKYTWPGLHNDVIKYLAQCLECKKSKIQRHTKAPMEITSSAEEAFDKVYLDLVGPLPSDDNGNKYILTIQCELTKYIEAQVITDKESETVARCFVKDFVLRYGNPRIICTDQGKEFVSDLFKKVAQLLEIETEVSTPYHHESIGALENSHKQLNNFLQIQTNKYKDKSWSEWVPYWVFSHNNSVHSATGYAPAELVFGKFTNMPSKLNVGVDPIYNFDSYISELRYRIQIAQEDARNCLVESKHNYKKYYDKKCYYRPVKVGDKILVLNNCRKNKLDTYYVGPFTIKGVQLPNITIDYKGKDKIIHLNNTKLV